jgi:predicted Zn-dependent protease
VRRGREFVHPDLRFRFEVPEGYALVNGPERVVARHSNGAAIVFDMVRSDRVRTVRDLASYVGRDWGAKLQGPVERMTVNGMEAATTVGSTRVRSGEVDVRLIAIRERTDRIYRFMFVTPPTLTARESLGLKRTTYSFRTLSAEDAAAIEPLRLSIITVNPGDSAALLAERMPFERFRIERFETLNGLAREAPLTPGARVKLVTGGGSRVPY